ncbi:MAG: hypothetical protein JWL63_3280 [Rhodocyclales bacterium]|nr:hypothetical protein [Rhodocyclales bacterium]
MYFAIDPHSPDLPVELAAELDRAVDTLRAERPNHPFHVFALVDGAFDETIFASRKWAARSLYEGGPLHALGKAAPHLLAAPSARGHLPWLKTVFAACNGMPMLSIITSALPLDDLLGHLRPYLIARTTDGMEWPVRWGDTRVLPTLLTALDEAQRTSLLSPLHAWYCVQRDGSLISWPGATIPQQDPAGFDKLPLSDEAFAQLVAEAEADAVLADIYDTQPDLLQQRSGAACHGCVAQHLDLAGKHGIRAAGARQHFSALALNLREGFAEHPAMAALLQRTRQGADYLQEIATLPDSFWDEMASS